MSERLGSGMRINRASDDAAGLSITSTLRAKERVFSQAVRNLTDGISFLNIVEGSLGELTSITTRIRELSAQSANGIYSTEQRAALDREGRSLVDEYNRIVATTTFNGRAVFQDSTRESASETILRLQAGFGEEGLYNIAIGSELARTTGDGTFTALSEFNTGNYTISVDLGDVNGDGKVDLLAGRFSGAQIHFGNGDGTFGAGTTYPMGGANLHDATLGDLDNDGDLDIVSISGLGTDTFSSRLNLGDGTFGARTTYLGSDYSSSSSSISTLELTDLNGDGFLDAVAGSANALDVFIGNGDGTFQERVSYTMTGPRQVSLGDFNGDGHTDVVTTSDNAIALFVNNGDGTLAAPVTYAGGAYTDYGTAADFNGDGRSDFAVRTNSATYQVLFGQADGTLTAGATLTGNTDALKAADLDGDGNVDILLTGSQFSVERGNGDGTFTTHHSWSSAVTNTFDVAVADLNGDGAIDIIGIDQTSDLMQVSLGNFRSEMSIDYLDLTTQTAARSSLDAIEIIQARVSAEIGQVGVAQSRINAGLNVMRTMVDSNTAARSRIEDADIAEESSLAIRHSILQQTAAAVLAQANQAPRLALDLLRP